MKTAVVLMNLGGPSAPETIKPFLFNFFMDKNIIQAPLPVRWLVAKWISFSRGNGAAKEAYAPLGGKSPLLENTQEQAAALQAELNRRSVDAKVFVSMRYWHPRASEVAADVRAYGADKIILLPLYPQFSTTTSFSSIQEWERNSTQAADKLCCYPLQDGFIQASAKKILTALKDAPENTRVLFSAHGLPEKIITDGDPYQYQCEITAAAIAKQAGLRDWQICYQSRVGPLKWIGPSTEEAMQKAADDKVGIVIYPHAFVSEHVETLVEIGMEYRHKAEEMGIPYFGKADTVGAHPLFISGLADLVQEKISGAETVRICPQTFTRCGCKL
jgi:ferrochelatase